MPKRPLTRGDGVALRLMARVGLKQAREEPDPELAEQQRERWIKTLEEAWPPLRLVKPNQDG